MIDAQKFRTPGATYKAAMKVAATIQDRERFEEFVGSLYSQVPTFYRVAVAQKFFEQLPSQNTPHFPDNATMVRRMNLILEELKETFEKGLGIGIEFTFYPPVAGDTIAVTSVAAAIERSDRESWDMDEFADGLSDMNVVIAGTGVECAIPMDLIDWDNHCANMSKLGDDARPQINGVTPGFRRGEEVDRPDEPGYRPDLPTGKWIKGPNYVQTNPSYIMGLSEE